MRILQAAAIAAAAAVSGCSQTIDPTVTSSISRSSLEKPGAHAFVTQTPRVSTSCFPDELDAILAKLHRKFGVAPVVTSGHRPRAGRSQHASCKAADIRIPGVSPSRIANYARTINGIGGVGTYRHKGIVHVDVGPRRDWRH